MIKPAHKDDMQLHFLPKRFRTGAQTHSSEAETALKFKYLKLVHYK